MIIKEIERFKQARYKLRAYVSYLFERNLPNHLPGVNESILREGFDKIAHEVDGFEAFYLLDACGVQLGDAICVSGELNTQAGKDRSNRAYYYRAVREQHAIITDPYPSSINGELCVTASMPVYDDKGVLKFVACMDISLSNILKIAGSGWLEGCFDKTLKGIYALFCAALLMICAVLFYRGVESFLQRDFRHINIEEIFSSTIILTLALAIFDLVKTIFEEEVIGENHNNDTLAYKTMVRFIGSIIIALAIEALMLVFKFAITAPEQIVNAIYLIGGVSLLMVSLSLYLFAANRRKKETK
ncbi:PDC sensor domain-containing protein [Campylobacter sp. 19-13652]|uniref:PDC sensor domain-containing protein n=1 Tax=Campylobacter sp. 19-13652 TaxID=2840180 RepID=UPI001C7460B7|nr:PDC sensor domain-containing protein [Campylobacter sp. 19-13652]BCX79944.1 membrane protein [Campylobacter sp. 19-13652]